MTTPADRLRMLQTLADQAGHADLSDWCKDAAQMITAGLPADLALGLRGPLAIRARDKLLRAAAPLTGRETTWQQAGALAAILNRLDRIRRTPTAVDQLLIDAEEHTPCPRSQRQLYTILITEIEAPAASVDDDDNQPIEPQYRKQSHG